jgi:uncharacterized cupredoxin-like copper-binding protein
MRNKILIFAALAALTPVPALAAGQHAGGHGHDESTAYGKPGDAARVTRTVVVEASDNMRYTPDVITVRRGETVKFVVKNTGKIPHELVLGDEKSLKEHAEVMRKYPDMEHEDPNMAKVAPGGTGTLVWKFTEAGTVNFACLIPGHYEAGMKGSIRVGAK